MKRLLLMIAVALTSVSCQNHTESKKEMPIKSGYADVNGIHMYYEEHGDQGPPLVLIHGGGSTIETSFEKMIPLLSPHFHVIAVELQAHGHTSDRSGPESFERDADDVAALMQHLMIDKASFFGFSNGANTSMQIAIRHPQLVNKLVLASGFYRRDGMFPGFFDMLEKGTLQDIPQSLRDNFLAIEGNDSTKLMAMFNKDRLRMVTFKDWDEDMLRAIQAPALVISGDKDVMSAEHTLALARLLPHGRPVVLPGNHGSLLGQNTGADEPQLHVTTAELVKGFLLRP